MAISIRRLEANEPGYDANIVTYAVTDTGYNITANISMLTAVLAQLTATKVAQNDSIDSQISMYTSIKALMEADQA